MTDIVREPIEVYERVLIKIREQHARLRDECIPQVAGLLTAPIGIVLPPGVKGMIQDIVRSALQTLYDILARVHLLLQSGLLSVRLHVNAEDWVLVSTKLGAVVGDLRPENRPVPGRWRGVAAEAYEQAVAGQRAAAAQLRAAAQAVSFALNWLAMSVLALSVALLALLVQICAIVIGAVLAFLSGVGIPAALTALSAAVPALAIQITGLMVAAAESYARAKTFLDDMRAKALDMSSFPNGSWPHLDPARYNDATVSDGDPSDWAIAG